MSNKKYKLANWSPDKNESPYEYRSEYPKYEYTPYNFKILDDAEAERVFKEELIEEKSRGEIFICLGLWDVHLIEEPRTSRLIRPTEYQDPNGNKKFYYFEILCKTDNIISENQPIRAYATYPFHTVVEQIIFPLNLTTFWAELKTSKILPIGYIAWQISKLYSDLYKNFHRKAGVYGHSLSDLQLSSLKIYENNKMSIVVDS